MKSRKLREVVKMRLKVYISNLTPKNRISIFVNEVLELERDVYEGMWDLEVKVPIAEEFVWSIEFEKSVVPRKEGIGEDIRELAGILTEIEITE